MPIVFSPVLINGVHYVDGGLFRNFPVSTIRDECEYVIGVNVSPLIPQRYKQTLLHIAERTYHYVFKADEVTPNVLKNFKERHLLDIKDNKSKSDAVLSILAFIYDFNFEESLDILVETDNFDLFVSTIEVAEDSEKLWLKVREICYDAINEGIHHE